MSISGPQERSKKNGNWHTGIECVYMYQKNCQVHRKGVSLGKGIISVGFEIPAMTERYERVPRNSVSRTETASVIVILCDGACSQQLLIMSQTRSESSGLSGRGGRVPPSIK
jgi:hypothetical protein